MNSSSKKLIKESQASAYSMPYLEGDGSGYHKSTRPPKKTPEMIEREAFEKGFASGEQAGFEMGRQRADVMITRLETIFNELTSLREKIIKDLEPQVILLGITLTRKILKEELSLRPEIIAQMVKEGLYKISRTGTVSIRVNPSLLDFLGKKKEEFLSIYQDIQFETDNQLPEGGAVVSCLSEEVQTDLDFQLSNIIEELRTKAGNG
jgi:flagellar biosynthesis/type III secretory pathway protein FliH